MLNLNNINFQQLLADGTVYFAITLIVVGVFIKLMPYLQKKGIKVDNAIDNTKQVLNTADQILDVVSPLIPQAQIIDRIIEMASICVKNIEQVSKTQQLSNEEKKINAISSVETMLSELNIQITPQRQQIIDIAIEAAVNQLKSTNSNNNSNSTKTVTTVPVDTTTQIQGTTAQTIEKVQAQDKDIVVDIKPVDNTNVTNNTVSNNISINSNQTDAITRIQNALQQMKQVQ